MAGRTTLDPFLTRSIAFWEVHRYISHGKVYGKMGNQSQPLSWMYFCTSKIDCSSAITSGAIDPMLVTEEWVETWLEEELGAGSLTGIGDSLGRSELTMNLPVQRVNYFRSTPELFCDVIMEKIFTTYWFWSDLLDYLLWDPKAHSLLFLTVDDLIYFFLFVKCCLSFIKLFNLLLDLFLRLKKKETSLISHKERAVGLVEEGGRRTGEGVSAKGAYCPSVTLWADNSSAPTPAGPSFKSEAPRLFLSPIVIGIYHHSRAQWMT